MRRAFLAVLALMPLTFLAGRVDAQISLIPAPAVLVTQSPRFIAVADFNRDGVKDVVVTNSTSDKVSVLFGTRTGGNFSTSVNIAVGRSLRGIAAGDLNNDANPDIVVVDAIDGKAFIIPGNGDGSFKLPFNIKVGARPQDVGIGNFDAVFGSDLVVANEFLNTASILLNAGGNRGFDPAQPLPVGKNPTRVEAADLTGDGFDDIVTVNAGTIPADSISVLINQGNSSFPSTPLNFIVGAGARDLGIGDFNSDGVPDILVLNGGASGTANQFSVSVLINKTVLKNGRRVGTGFFNLLQAVKVPCPRTIGGININCTPNFMTVGDYDNDGNLDFAVSFFTQAQTGVSTATSGLVEAFQGHGDGSFDFSSQQTVGFDPQGIASGDFDGDGVPDIAVANRGSRTVQLLHSVPPPKQGDGSACTTGVRCLSGFCVNNTCCGSSSCPADQFCNIPGRRGKCAPAGDDGAHPCTDPAQCQSGFCVDEFCCAADSCADGQFCNTGSCQPPTTDGTPCNAPAQCSSGFCTDGACCVSATCPAGLFCNIPGNAGQCALPLPVPSACDEGNQCETGACIDGVCCGSVQCFPGQPCLCPFGQGCNVPGQEGQCVPLPTPTTTPTKTTTPTRTPTPQPNGAACTGGGQCISGNCVDNTCCNIAVCPDSLVCNMPNSPGTCAMKAQIGDTCTIDQQCTTGNCQAGPTPACAPVRTATPTLTPTPVPPGGVCSTSPQCAAPNVCNTEHFCCLTATCPTGQSCRVAGFEGVCTTPPTSTPQPTSTTTQTPTPTKRVGGSSCDSSNPDSCVSGLCTDNVCCTSASCTAPMRCDIFGFEGDCTVPLPADFECRKNSDCAEGLVCDFDINAGKDVCTVHEPTPTFPPINTPTAPPDAIVKVSRGGGCSIADNRGGSGAWLLTALPIAFWMRRRQHVRVRIQGRRGSK